MKLFAKLGAQIERRPKFFIAFGLLISLLSLGALQMHLKDQIRDGYTPENAPSRHETLVMREFWNASADPIMTIILVRARDGGNMLRMKHLNETSRLSSYLMNEFQLDTSSLSVRDAEFDAELAQPTSVTYAHLCFPFCDANVALETFVMTLENELALFNENSSLTDGITLYYPVSRIHDYKVYLERMFFGVKMNERNGEGTPEQIVTNMDSIKVVMLLFRGDRSSPGREAALSAWELAVYDYFQTEHRSDLLQVDAIGTEILDREMLEDGQKVIPFFAGGFLATVLFVFVTVIGRSLYSHTFTISKIWYATASLISPTFAILMSYGIMSLLGLRVNSFLLLLPYLVFGIGVDDGFLIMHTATMYDATIKKPDEDGNGRLAMVLSEVGPSITVTTLTNVISFAIGAFSPTPEIRLFCFGTTLALSLVFILQFFFLCPVLELTKNLETTVLSINDHDASNSSAEKALTVEGDRGGLAGKNEASQSPKRETKELTHKTCAFDFEKSKSEAKADEQKRSNKVLLFEWYCRLVSSRIFALFLCAIMATYWYFTLRGTFQIQTRLDASKVLPPGSRIQSVNLILDHCVWKDYHSVTVLINKEFDLQNQTQINDFDKMVDEFEKIPKCRGSESSMIWLREYRNYLNSSANENDYPFIFDLLPGGETPTSEVGNVTNEATNATLNDSIASWDKLDEFTASEELIPPNKRKRSAIERAQVSDEKNSLHETSTCKLQEFLDSPFQRHWHGFLRYEIDNKLSKKNAKSCPKIKRFWFTVAYHDTATWDDRIPLMVQWREIAQRYSSSLNSTVWEQNAMFVDQMLSLKTTTIQSVLLTLCCMVIICTFFISNPFSVIVASVVIASITLGVFGFLSLMHYDLDPITMAALLMSIGLSVDYTAHVAYHFQQNSCLELCDGVAQQIPLATRAAKLRHTLRAVGWPLIQAAISTALCVSPLILVNKYAAGVFFFTIFAVTVLGLAHGLLVLPCILVNLPGFCSTGNFYIAYCTRRARKSYAIEHDAQKDARLQQSQTPQEKTKMKKEFLV